MHSTAAKTTTTTTTTTTITDLLGKFSIARWLIMIRYQYLALFTMIVGPRKSRGLDDPSRPIYFVCSPISRDHRYIGSVPTKQPPIKIDVLPSRKESLARPSPAESAFVIALSPTKEKTENEALVCVYRIPKKVKFNVPNVGPLKRKNTFPEKVEITPELKEGVNAFSFTDPAPMLIQKNLGGGKALW